MCDLLNDMGLQQHVRGPTHRFGHTLDWIISRTSNNLIFGLPIVGPFISDHAAIICKLKLKKPPSIYREMQFRKLNQINIDSLRTAVSDSVKVTPRMGIDHMVDQYNEQMGIIIDQFAPIITVNVPVHVRQSWFNDILRVNKVEK